GGVESRAKSRPPRCPCRGASLMTMLLTCPGCKGPLKIPEAALGIQLRCPKCGAAFFARAGPPESPPAPKPAPPEEPVRGSRPAAPEPPGARPEGGRARRPGGRPSGPSKPGIGLMAGLALVVLVLASLAVAVGVYSGWGQADPQHARGEPA